MITAFTASLTYMLGASDMGSFRHQVLGTDQATPKYRYATKVEMERVGFASTPIVEHRLNLNTRRLLWN